MDPLTAFSLACGVIQVVDFGTKIVAKCRQIYKDGATSENRELESMARYLTDLVTQLKCPNTVGNSGSTHQMYHDDHELLELAKQCSGTATELINELQKLSISGRQRKRDAIFKTIKAASKKKAIEHIQSRLEQYLRTLDTRILISLRKYAQLILSEQSDGFKNLDRKIQNLIIGTSENQNTFDELKDLIAAENASSKEHTSQEFQKHREMNAAGDFYKNILDSLYFQDIHARQEGIEEAHKHTFEWIFDKPGVEVRPWDNFIDWLEKGRGTYWISGKAGSGKSTLMNFICDDPRTNAALKIWSGNTEVFMPKFFFWNPGSQLQKSLTGLLRSLIYQILERFPHLMPVVTKYVDSPHQLPTWTEKRLRATLQDLLSVGPEQCYVCIFIDGLDEYHDDPTTLLDLIRNLREITRVKFCLSSRPYSSFSHELGSSPMLKLQDLTERDIRKYVSDKLQGAHLKASRNPHFSISVKDDVVDIVVRKADGVFLWVRLAVRDQLEGIRNGDNAKLLRERIQILPMEIEKVYCHMLQGIDKVYRKEVARYVRSVLEVEDEQSLFTFALAEHERIDDIVLSSKCITVGDIHQHCISIRERIATTCKGFLEVHQSKSLEEWQKMVAAPAVSSDNRLRFEAEIFSKSLKDRKVPLKQREELTVTKFFHEYTRVDFLHRTAFDFFKDNEQGKDFLKIHTTANPHPQVLYVKALLANLIIFPLSMDNFDVQESIHKIMSKASTAEQATGVAQPALVDLIDRSMTRLYEKSLGQPSDLHWCRTWGCSTPEGWSSVHYHHNIASIAKRPSEPRNNDTPSFHSVDFLGLAAWYGLDMYVEHSLGSHSGWQTSGTADHLLSCSIGGFAHDCPEFISILHLRLIVALLEQGADPNMRTTRGTVWTFLLQAMLFISFESQLRLSFYDTLSETWRKLSKPFLQSGANVNEMISSYVASVRGQLVINSSDSPPFKLEFAILGVRLSARSVLQQCLGKGADFIESEEPLVASGAVLYVECTDIILRVSKEDDVRYFDANPSNEQLSRFTEILESFAYLSPVAEDCNERHEILEYQLVELCMEVDIPQLYQHGLTEREIESIIEQEESPQEDQSSINSDSVSNRPSMSAPDAPTLEAEGPSHSARSSQEED